MNEIGPGVYHWKALHPGIKVEVSSYYVADSATLIDPLLPPDGVEWLRDHPPERIVLTNRHHYRQSDEIRREFDCPVLCHEAGLHEFVGGPEVDGFRFGDRLAPGGSPRSRWARSARRRRTLYLEVGDGMMSLADGVIHYGDLAFVPDSLLGDDSSGSSATCANRFAACWSATSTRCSSRTAIRSSPGARTRCGSSSAIPDPLRYPLPVYTRRG